jgi:predicted Zn finger-like uncharacterized protein
MRVVCPGCKATYNFSQDLLPQRKTIAFKCKRCGSLIQFARSPVKEQDPTPIPSGNKASQTETRDIQAPAEPDAAKVRALKSKIRMCLMGFIPPVAHVIAKAQKVMANPFSDLRDLVEVIETDQGITTNALRVANSAYYGLSGKVVSISHASVLLGNKILGEIITMAGARGFLGESLRGYGLDSGILWRHSLAVGVGSKLLAVRKCPELEQDAFVSGLLHDAGMIMLDPHIFEKKDLFDGIVREGSHTFLQAERMVLGIDHSEVGAEMFGEWGLPRALLKPVANHHRPAESGGALGYVVHVADIMARRCGYGTGVDDMLYTADSGAMEFLGLEEEALTDLQSELGESVQKITTEVLDEPV